MSAPTTEKSQRPLSPHLQIYKPQMTSMLSILHRMTGAALVVGLLLMVWWIAAAAYSEEAYNTFMLLASAWYGQIILAGLSFCYIYHFFNGIRHLIWDSGHLFKIENATAAGYLIFWGSVVITALLWAAIYMG